MPLRMKSQKQAVANRRNAQQSSGPKSDGGKRRSSVNATKHGLTAPLESSGWAPQLETIAQLLMERESLSEIKANELARCILEYERNVSYQRELYEMMVQGRKPVFDTAGVGWENFIIATHLELGVSSKDNYGGFGKEGARDIAKFFRGLGKDEVRKAQRDAQREFRSADRYLRRAANQLIKQCRSLSSPLI